MRTAAAAYQNCRITSVASTLLLPISIATRIKNLQEQASVHRVAAREIKKTEENPNFSLGSDLQETAHCASATYNKLSNNTNGCSHIPQLWSCESKNLSP